MVWTTTPANTTYAGFTDFDYCTPTTTSSSYFDRVTNNSGYYTGGTGDIFDQRYCTVPYYTVPYYTVPYYTVPRFETPRGVQIEERPRSQPCQHSQPPKPSSEEIEAQAKARNLLLEYLDQDNKRKYLEKKPIEVVSKLFGDIRYQIPISKLDKICALKDGKIVSRLCLVVREPEHIPLEDIILTKFLHILNDEECVLRTANHSSVVENLLARLN